MLGSRWPALASRRWPEPMLNNGSLSFRQSELKLSSYAGLELLRSYLVRIQLTKTVRSAVVRHLPGSDYGAVSMTLALLALLFTGGRRLRHLDELAGDPVVERFCAVKSMPTARSVTRWLTRIDARGVEALRTMNKSIVGQALRSHSLPRLTVDVDGSVLSTGMQVEGARRGYNPHRRKVPSYYPISAYEANSGVMLNVLNRAGNVHDGKASVEFIADVLEQCRTSTDRTVIREMRMDGAFFRRDILELMDQENVEYAIKAPFHDWLGLKQVILDRVWWYRVDDEVEYFQIKKRVAPWKRTEKFTIYRRRVNHKRSKPHQLDLFDPDDGHYEYSAIASNKSLAGPSLWKFMNGRGTHEKVYAELKSGFAFASIPTQRYDANSAWQLLNLIAFNLNRGMQSITDGTVRAKKQNRRTLQRFEHINTVRNKMIAKAGLLLNVSGVATLDIGANKRIYDRFFDCQAKLLATA